METLVGSIQFKKPRQKLFGARHSNIHLKLILIIRKDGVNPFYVCDVFDLGLGFNHEFLVVGG